jgi:hypothetical protein
MKRLIILAAALIALPAQAQFYTGNDLAEWMRGFEKVQEDRNPDNEDYINSSRFVSYIAGIADFIVLSEEICYGEEMRLGQAGSVVAKYLKDNPEDWGTAGSILVTLALAEAFPCEDAAGKPQKGDLQ